MDVDVDVYIFFGHGCEYIGQRFTVPTGYTLVTVEECGKSVGIPIPGRVARFLKQNPSIAENPKYGVSLGGIAARVYKAGDQAPLLLFKHDSTFGKPAKFVLSGLHKFPLEEEDIRLLETPQESTGSKADVERAYRKSVFPTLESLPRAEVTYSVREIMNKFGPNVYYFPICRDVCVETPETRTLIPIVRQKSKQQQEMGKLLEGVADLSIQDPTEMVDGGRKRRKTHRRRRRRANASSSRRLPSLPTRKARRSFS